MGFEVLTPVKMTIDTNILQEHTVFIFRADALRFLLRQELTF